MIKKMARTKKEVENREHIIIQIYYEDYKNLENRGKKSDSFADIVHRLLEVKK